MELKDGDVEKINALLRHIGVGGAKMNIVVAEALNMDIEELLRLRIILTEHNAFDSVNPNAFIRNNNTRNYHDANYFGEVYNRQEESRKNKKLELEKLQLEIVKLKKDVKWAKWATWISIGSAIIALLALILKFCAQFGG